VLFKKRILCEDTTTLAKIASRFGVSRERVRQIEGRLKARLRAHLRAVLGDAVPAEEEGSAGRASHGDDSWN
jgi:RNA polymerase sigma-32 factor